MKDSSPTIQVVSVQVVQPRSGSSSREDKATVPEMHILYDLIARAALDAPKLRRLIGQCTPEERAVLHSFFIRAAAK